jgi:hypothetical protein
MRSKTIEFTAPTADEADSLTVTITNDGYMDDSVRGEKYSLELKSERARCLEIRYCGKGMALPARSRKSGLFDNKMLVVVV